MKLNELDALSCRKLNSLLNTGKDEIRLEKEVIE